MYLNKEQIILGFLSWKATLTPGIPSFTFYSFFSFLLFLALDETNTHASATTCHTTTTTSTTTTTTTSATKKLKYPKSTLQTRPQALYSQRIVIGSEELHGRDIDNVVRQKIDTLDKSPKVVRSTALIVKRSVAPAKTKTTINGTATLATTKKVPNGDVKSRTTAATGGDGEDNVDAGAGGESLDRGDDPLVTVTPLSHPYSFFFVQPCIDSP